MKKEKNGLWLAYKVESKQSKTSQSSGQEKKPSNRANNMKNNLFELAVKLASERANGQEK